MAHVILLLICTVPMYINSTPFYFFFFLGDMDIYMMMPDIAVSEISIVACLTLYSMYT